MALSKDRMCRGRGWAHAWELMLATSLGSRPARNAGPLAQLTCCPPRSHPGLPDEAFETLTQLEHLYVAHNKVSLYVALRGCILAGVAQDAGPGCGSWGGGAGSGHLDQMLLLLQLSVAPQFLPHSLRVADLAANEVAEIFPLTFGEKPELR